MSTHQLQIRRLQPSESRELREWIIARHYLASAPPGYRFALEVLLTGERIGGLLLGRPAARSLDPLLWVELTRMYFIDETPPNVESQALSAMRRWLRVWEPRVVGLLSYSDPEVGHLGTVYRADGWAPFGMTSNGAAGWKNRPNRKAEGKPSRKVRWVRTP